MCARSEGELCDDTSEFGAKYGVCGENLVCSKRSDVDSAEATCRCQVEKMVCGSDKVTYPTIWSVHVGK